MLTRYRKIGICIFLFALAGNIQPSLAGNPARAETRHAPVMQTGLAAGECLRFSPAQDIFTIDFPPNNNNEKTMNVRTTINMVNGEQIARARHWEFKFDCLEKQFVDALGNTVQIKDAYIDQAGIIVFRWNGTDETKLHMVGQARIEAIAEDGKGHQSYDNSRTLTIRGTEYFDREQDEIRSQIDMGAKVTLTDYYRSLVDQAYVSLADGEVKDAIIYFEKARAINGTDPWLLLALGDAYFAPKKYLRNGAYFLGFTDDDCNKAISCYSHALELNSKLNRVYLRRGLCWWRMDQYESCLQEYLKAVQADPDDKMVEYHLGRYCYSVEKNKALAIRHYQAFYEWPKASEYKEEYSSAAHFLKLMQVNKP